MLTKAPNLLLLSLIAGLLGFGLVAGTPALIAKMLFLNFLVLFVVSRLGYEGAELRGDAL